MPTTQPNPARILREPPRDLSPDRPRAHEVEIKRVGTRVVIRTRDLNAAQAAERALKYWVMHGRFD